jgi:hypothetical protein
MAAAKAALPIAAVRTGGKWTQDFTFFTDRAMTTPEDWTGRSAILSLVPRDPDNIAEGAFQLTSEADGGLVMLSNGAGIRVASTATAGLVPDTYDFELAWLDDGEPVPVLIGSISIEQGLMEIAEGEELQAPVTTSGAAGQVVRVYAAAGVVQVVQGAGIQGESGLVISETEPPVAAGKSVLWLKPVGDQYDLLIVTGD